MNGPVGAVVALPSEARCLVGHRCVPGGLYRKRGLLLQVAGVGADRATRAGVALLAAGAESLLSFGVAAGLAPGVPAGTLVLPAQVVAADGRRLATDDAWRARWAACSGQGSHADQPLAETRVVLADVDAKRALAARTGAIAADMESAAVLSVAASAGVPGLVVRCVLDPLEQALPAAALAALREDGSSDLAGLVLALLRRPGEWRTLAALARGHARARRALAGFAGRALAAGPPFAVDDAARHARQNPPRRTPTPLDTRP